MASIISTVRDIERLRQIVVVLMRHGFGEIVQRAGLDRFARRPSAAPEDNNDPLLPSSPAPARITFGQRLRLVLQDLGPSFVKLGQILSTRPDLIPADIILELKKLQDDVPPVDVAELREEVEIELGAPIDDLFSRFDIRPIGCASMAQVHRAELRGDAGRPPLEVVLKIQRPRIRGTVERDVELLYFFARAIERNIPEARIYSPVGLVSEFDSAITAELDFLREADHAERFARSFADDPTTRFPVVYRQASAHKVLTLEYLKGLKVHDAVAAGHSGERIAKLGLHSLFKQIFEDGFFHADPHPGNILILGDPENPVFGLIDLGLVGRLSPDLRDKTVDLMVAAVKQDAKGVADALYAIGTPTRRIDRTRYEAEVTMLAEKYLGKPLKEIEISSLIRDIVGGAVKYGLEIPPEFLMLGRTLMTIEGVGKEIYPDLDVFSEVRPYFMKLLVRRYSPDRLGADALRMFSRFRGTAGAIPEKLDDVLDDLRRGRLQVKTSDPELPRATELLGRRIFSGLAVASLLGSGSLLVASSAAVLPGYVMLGLAGGWFLLHALRSLLANRDMLRRLRE